MYHIAREQELMDIVMLQVCRYQVRGEWPQQSVIVHVVVWGFMSYE